MDSSILSTFSLDEKKLVMASVQATMFTKPVEEGTVLACFQLLQVLQSEVGLGEEAASDKIDEVRRNCTNPAEKTATRITSSLLGRLLSKGQTQKSESNLIIEILRPFLLNCIISPCPDVKFEWMTYRMIPLADTSQLMIPDLAVFVDPLSTVNFELFVVEVKKHGNCSNGSLEKDVVKLGKEMQLAIDKLMIHKVEDPEVAGLLVEGEKATAFKMDLRFDGQYRMIELSTFFFVRENINVIMLIPGIMQKLDQLKCIISETRGKLFEALKKKNSSYDKTSFMRKGCGSPVLVSNDAKKHPSE